MDELRSPQDYLAIAKRRKWYFVVPVVVIFPIFAAIALLLPPVYQSSATILIEEPEIPRELVSSTIGSYADQRLQSIYHRITASQNLTTIINKYDLYPEARARQPLTDVIASMREAVKMNVISADVIDPRSGRPGKATIAFNLAFDHQSPATAQRVANELVSLYLAENLRVRQESAAKATTFLAGESARLERDIAEIEKRLGELKERNVGSLPEQLNYNLQLIERGEQEQRELARQTQTLQERQIYLEAQLLQMSRYGFVASADGGRFPTPEQRLELLRTQMIAASAHYGDRHPDVSRLRREIEALERETASPSDAAGLREQLSALRTEFAVARERYSEDHPDVARLQRQVVRTEASLAEAERASPATSIDTRAPDNPAYIQMQAQLEATRSQMRAIEEQSKAVAAKLASYEERITRTPVVEREYLHLRRLQDDATRNYHEIKGKEMAAELGQALETERKSERFSLIEPPIQPTEPVSPNRIAILVIGFVLSMGAGAGAVTLAELSDTSVHGPRQLTAITGMAPLAVIPFIRTRADRLRAWRQRAMVGVGSASAAGALALYVHFNVRPLDVLWVGIERRLDTLVVQYLW